MVFWTRWDHVWRIYRCSFDRAHQALSSGIYVHIREWSWTNSFRFYLGLTKSSAIVIGNFINQLTFKRFLHGEIVECLIYNDIYSKSILDLVIVFFQISFYLNQKQNLF